MAKAPTLQTTKIQFPDGSEGSLFWEPNAEPGIVYAPNNECVEDTRWRLTVIAQGVVASRGTVSSWMIVT